MAADERRDFSDARFDGMDFSHARLHAPNFEGATISDAWLLNADVSGGIEGLRINGVEVAPLVEAELDRRSPDRAKLRATDPAGIAEAWAIIEEVWRTTVERARALPEPALHERVDGEWSFVETLRHLIMATDKWLSHMVLQIARPYHPLGLAGSFLEDPESLGLDAAADPSLDEVLAVRRGRMDAVAETIGGLTPHELERRCDPPAGLGHPTETCSVLTCLQVILREEWEHAQYANRDLAILEAAT